MHIGPATHEHRASAKVYTYEGDYDLTDRDIRWKVRVTHAEESPRTCDGAIPLTSPGTAAVAEEAVRDAIVRRIDSFSGDKAL